MSRYFTRDPYLEIAAGRAGKSSVNKFGGSVDATKDVTTDIWDGGGTYVFETSAAITHIRAAADSATTQGATIEVQGLDTNWDLVVQTKDLDGSDSTDEVALDTPLRRVFRMRILEDATADQDIWAGDSAMASVAEARAIITAGNNQTLMVIYTVPSGKTAYMTQYYYDYSRTVAKDPDGLEFSLWVADRDNSYAFQLKHKKGLPKQAPGKEHPFKPYLKITEKSDIKMSVLPQNKDANVHAGFDIILEDN